MFYYVFESIRASYVGVLLVIFLLLFVLDDFYIILVSLSLSLRKLPAKLYVTLIRYEDFCDRLIVSIN